MSEFENRKRVPSEPMVKENVMDRVRNLYGLGIDIVELSTEKSVIILKFISRHGVKILFWITLLSVVAWLMATVSFTTYSVFRYMYLPSAQHIAPVHLNFDVNNNRPFAEVQLAEPGGGFLSAGQEYDMSIFLELPESDVNKDIGMFMIDVEMYSEKTANEKVTSALTVKSSRHSMLRYQSALLYYISTVFFTPAFIAGVAEQKQNIHVFLIEKFRDSSDNPSTKARISLNKPVQLYKAHVQFDAHFTGLRALMYWYPVLSAVIFNGVLFSSLFILSILVIGIGYLQYVNTVQEDGWDDLREDIDLNEGLETMPIRYSNTSTMHDDQMDDLHEDTSDNEDMVKNTDALSMYDHSPESSFGGELSGLRQRTTGFTSIDD